MGSISVLPPCDRNTQPTQNVPDSYGSSVHIPTELQIAAKLKKVGFKYVCQFTDFNMPIFFKSELKIGPFMRSEPGIHMLWVKNIDEYIESLT